MVFITCGLGGGTGTGGAPVLAQLSKEAGALTIAICTFPFRAEGAIRAENAEYGLEKLRSFADTVVVIPNDKLLRSEEHTSELQSRSDLVCRLLLEKKKITK